jgi:hypothetical protein
MGRAGDPTDGGAVNRVTRRLAGGLLGLALAAACGHRGPAAPEAPLDTTVRLRVGDFVVVSGGLRLGFTGVPSDSRCPGDVACVWEGDATVRLSADPPAGVPRALELHTSARADGAPEAVVDGYRVRLEGLEPAPRSGAAIPPAAYVALVRVDRP